ncbi:MAG: LysR substrate-binding domain-containing protein [Xanthomonadales bacterium]|nr:LysR substrate-binding domain-containing protein [Xanthomonadales bacterium]
MKLQQLRYLVAIADNGMNITAASQALFTSQPGVSKQVKLLEDELSLQLFTRRGKSLSGLTEAGKDVLERARKILTEVDNIKTLSQELAGQAQGELVVATTHTQARYVLPDLLERFHRSFPDISISLHQGTSDRIARQVQEQAADFAIASGNSGLFEGLVTFPIYRWERVILVMPDHPLARKSRVELSDLARYPIISYTHSFDEDSDQANAFRKAGINPNVVFTAEDPDVIKTYVRKGMGIGIVACMAYDPERDDGLMAIDAAHLFPSCATWIGFRNDRFLRDYMLSFLELLVPGADRYMVEEAIRKAAEPGGGVTAPVPSLPLNSHPQIERNFSSCCGGGFNL